MLRLGIDKGSIRDYNLTMELKRGLSRAPDIESIWPGYFNAPEEAKAETPNGVAWSPPCRGITEDLGGSLFNSILATGRSCCLSLGKRLTARNLRENLKHECIHSASR